MSRVRTRDTAPELLLRKALWSQGVRGWRLHPKRVVGRPDLAWVGRQVAVFVDGAFWHGHPGFYRGQSGEFWDKKIEKNRTRDRRVDRELEAQGWTVVRIWDFEIERDPARCARRVAQAMAGSDQGETNGRSRSVRSGA
jgi:DNA mismatch endonuclease (patch repair protein)